MKPKRFISYGRQQIDDDDKAAVVAALNGDHLTQGPLVERFEAAFAERVGARFAVAVSNGTAALHIACMAAEIGPGQKVVTSDLTFLASASAPLICGADVRLADVDAHNLCLSEDTVAQSMPGVRPDAIIPVHFAGVPAPMAGLRRQAGIIIEDAAHALGAKHEDGSDVGSCSSSDMCIFSFHPVKTITTGEGGMVTTNDADLARRLRLMRNHGIERDPRFFQVSHGEDAGPWSYEQQEVGLNYRLTDIQAALGISQLTKLDRFLSRRREIAARYDKAFAKSSVIKPMQADEDFRRRSGHHLYVVEIDFGEIGVNRTGVIESLREKGIGTQVHYIPLHRQPSHLRRGVSGSEMFPNTEAYYRKCLSIPLFPGLTDDEVEYVVSSMLDVVQS